MLLSAASQSGKDECAAGQRERGTGKTETAPYSTTVAAEGLTWQVPGSQGLPSKLAPPGPSGRQNTGAQAACTTGSESQSVTTHDMPFRQKVLHGDVHADAPSRLDPPIVYHDCQHVPDGSQIDCGPCAQRVRGALGLDAGGRFTIQQQLRAGVLFGGGRQDAARRAGQEGGRPDGCTGSKGQSKPGELLGMQSKHLGRLSRRLGTTASDVASDADTHFQSSAKGVAAAAAVEGETAMTVGGEATMAVQARR